MASLDPRWSRRAPRGRADARCVAARRLDEADKARDGTAARAFEPIQVSGRRCQDGHPGTRVRRGLREAVANAAQAFRSAGEYWGNWGGGHPLVTRPGSPRAMATGRRGFNRTNRCVDARL